jgi:hypothetical protein
MRSAAGRDGRKIHNWKEVTMGIISCLVVGLVAGWPSRKVTFRSA